MYHGKTEWGFDWYVDDSIPENIAYIFSPEQFVIENGIVWFWMKKEITLSPRARKIAIFRMIKEYKENKVPYYKLCLDKNDIVCYRCGEVVGENCMSVKSTSTTVSFRRYYHNECFEKLYQ